MRIAQTVAGTEAEGPGRRFAIWVQGCTIRCAECCNPEMFSARGGQEVEIDTLVEQILVTDDVEGVTFLGGEPFEQAEALTEVARRVREGGLSVMAFTGYTLDELRKMDDPHAGALIEACDLLVDGRYERDNPESGGRRWIGSGNQIMHFLTDRYDPDDPQFTAANTVEIRIQNGEVLINGWPSADALKEP